eukprot:s3538_g4.t1
MTQVRHPVVMNHLAHLRQLTVIAVEMVMSLLRANNSISCAICRALDKCNPHLSRRPVDSTPVQDAAGGTYVNIHYAQHEAAPKSLLQRPRPLQTLPLRLRLFVSWVANGMPGLRSGEAFHPGFQAPRPRSSAPLPRWPALTRPRADTEHIRNSDAQHCRLVGFGGRSNRATLTFLRLLLVGVNFWRATYRQDRPCSCTDSQRVPDPMSNQYAQGTLIWVKHEEEVWIQAEIVTSSEKAPSTAAALASIESNLSGDHRQDSRRSKWTSDVFTSEGLSVLDDLTQLTHLHEPAVLSSLQNRFDIDKIYTFTGPILIALNPFKHIPGLYDEEILKNFITTKPSTKPHVFSTSNASYRGICDRHKSQTVLISGESGAGKTETTKFVMKFLALAGSADGQVTDVEKQVLESNPLLEAFGNARTLRNDNSSRFGKFIELQFRPSQDSGVKGAVQGMSGESLRLCGARIRHYLLEKVRVCEQQEGERNYHIFYEACAAAAKLGSSKAYRYPQLLAKEKVVEEMDLDLEGFEELSNFAFLTRSSCKTLKDVDDVEMFERRIHAMQTIGIKKEDLSEIFHMIAAVLNLGNSKFDAPPNNSEGSMIMAECASNLAAAEKLLGIQSGDLEKALCHQTRITRSEKIRSPVNVRQAADNRDALAKALYGIVFNFIVHSTNLSIGYINDVKLFVGVLDIFGFECFKMNSFEQLCINFTNERLQQFFNSFVFKLEEQLYERENIPWDALDFPDNQDSVDLLAGKGTGVFAMLDEECLVPNGSDQGPRFCSSQRCQGDFAQIWGARVVTLRKARRAIAVPRRRRRGKMTNERICLAAACLVGQCKASSQERGRSRGRSKERRKERSAERKPLPKRGRSESEDSESKSSDDEEEMKEFLLSTDMPEEAASSECLHPSRDQMLSKMMGFSAFDSSKGRDHSTSDLSDVKRATKRQYRQYMNRRGYCNKLIKQHKGHRRFDEIKTKPTWFVIKHFAGPVSYCTDSFLDKNRDQLSNALGVSDVDQLVDAARSSQLLELNADCTKVRRDYIKQELNSMQVQSRAWSQLLDNQNQLVLVVQETRGEVYQLRKRMLDGIDSLYHGLELRKQLGTLANTHSLVQELHARRSELAEIQHMNYLRAQLHDLRDQLREVRDRLDDAERAGSSTDQLPIVRLAVPTGAELQLL